MYLFILSALLVHLVAKPMERQISYNPITHPHTFFNALDQSIMDQVTQIKTACDQQSKEAIITHLGKLIALLETAEEEKDSFLKAYNERNEHNKRPSEATTSPEIESLNHIRTFKVRTAHLLAAFTESEEALSQKEWLTLKKLFLVLIPEENIKRPCIEEKN